MIGSGSPILFAGSGPVFVTFPSPADTLTCQPTVMRHIKDIWLDCEFPRISAH